MKRCFVPLLRTVDIVGAGVSGTMVRHTMMLALLAALGVPNVSGAPSDYLITTSNIQPAGIVNQIINDGMGLYNKVEIPTIAAIPRIDNWYSQTPTTLKTDDPEYMVEPFGTIYLY